MLKAYPLLLTEEQRACGLRGIELCRKAIANSRKTTERERRKLAWLDKLAVKANQLPSRATSELHQPMPDTLEDIPL